MQESAMHATPSERVLRQRIAAHSSWAKTRDRTARTAPARAALEAKFLAEAEGDPARAEHLRKAHFARLALKSARSRRLSKQHAHEAAKADAELIALTADQSEGGDVA
jgi:hypothetical protein